MMATTTETATITWGDLKRLAEEAGLTDASEIRGVIGDRITRAITRAAHGIEFTGGIYPNGQVFAITPEDFAAMVADRLGRGIAVTGNPVLLLEMPR